MLNDIEETSYNKMETTRVMCKIKIIHQILNKQLLMLSLYNIKDTIRENVIILVHKCGNIFICICYWRTIHKKAKHVAEMRGEDELSCKKVMLLSGRPCNNYINAS